MAADTPPMNARKPTASHSKQAPLREISASLEQVGTSSKDKNDKQERSFRRTKATKDAGKRKRTDNKNAPEAADAVKEFMNDFREAHLIFKDSKRTRQKKPRRKPAHRRQQSSKSPFLSLPAEIRNLIYSYVIPSARILVRGSQPNKERAALQELWENQDQYVKRPRYRLSHMLDNCDIDNGCDVSASLLLVSRTINKEVELFMYSRLTFCFDSIKVINKFLDVASKPAIKEIRHLEIYHAGYGQPTHRRDTPLKVSHDRKWQATCARISNEMISLTSLNLDVTVREWPATMTANDDWWKMLRSLSKKPLDLVEARLQHSMVNHTKMADVSRQLEDSMMSDKGKTTRDEKEANILIQRYYEAEEERKAKLALLPPVQAKKVLNIVLENRGETGAQARTDNESKKYYSSRTKGFAVKFDIGIWSGGNWW